MTDHPLTPEAVERLADRLDGAQCTSGCGTMKFCMCAYAADSVDTLRALSAALEEWRAAATRHHPNPADFRYWEGRYRDEKARADALDAKMKETVGVLQEIASSGRCEFAKVRAFLASIGDKP